MSKNEWSFGGSVVVSSLEFESVCVSGLLWLWIVSGCIKVVSVTVKSIVEMVTAESIELLEIIVLVDGEVELIEAVEMAVGGECDGSGLS